MTTAAPTLRLTNAKATHDETKVSQAVAFLRHPQVQSTPLDERVAFLQQKGVGAAEIAAALARCGLQLPLAEAAVAAPQRSTPLLTGGLAVVAGALGALALRNYVRSSADDREPPPPPPAPPPPPSQGEEAGSAQLAELAELSKSLLEQHDGRLRQLEAQQTTAHRELKAELQELRGAIEAAQATLRTELLSGIAQLHAAPPVAAAADAAPAAATPDARVGGAAAAPAAAAATDAATAAAAARSTPPTQEGASSLAGVMRAMREGREDSLPHTGAIDDAPPPTGRAASSPSRAAAAPKPWERSAGMERAYSGRSVHASSGCRDAIADALASSAGTPPPPRPGASPPIPPPPAATHQGSLRASAESSASAMTMVSDDGEVRIEEVAPTPGE